MKIQMTITDDNYKHELEDRIKRLEDYVATLVKNIEIKNGRLQRTVDGIIRDLRSRPTMKEDEAIIKLLVDFSGGICRPEPPGCSPDSEVDQKV